MKMKLLHAAVIFTVLAGSTAVYAQMGPDQGGGPMGHGPRQPMSADQRLQHMTKQLNLTASSSNRSSLSWRTNQSRCRACMRTPRCHSRTA